ncbi:uncharacterized protein RHO17_005250 isoform 1-T1 [Thomomys bottae]
MKFYSCTNLERMVGDEIKQLLVRRAEGNAAAQLTSMLLHRRLFSTGSTTLMIHESPSLRWGGTDELSLLCPEVPLHSWCVQDTVTHHVLSLPLASLGLLLLGGKVTRLLSQWRAELLRHVSTQPLSLT